MIPRVPPAGEQRRIALAPTFMLACAVTLPACSMRSVSAAPPITPVVSPAPVVSATPPGVTAATFVIEVPRSTLPTGSGSLQARHRPEYVSPSTQSLAVAVYDAAHVTQITAVKADLTPASPGCVVPTPISPLTCSLAVPLQAGNYTFDATTYDQLGGAGNQLSKNIAMPATIQANAANLISMTLGGVPGSILLAPAAGSTTIGRDTATGINVVWGTTQTLFVIPLDADHNYIVGPGAPALTLTASNVSSGSGIAVAPPAGGNPNAFTFHSTGPGNATLIATATSATGTSVSAQVSLAATTLTTTLAGNPGPIGVGLIGYQDGTGTGALFDAPQGIAFDSADGNLYVTDYGNCAIRKVTPTGVVTTLAGAPASGGQNCKAIDGPSTVAQFAGAAGIAYDAADGNLYVTDGATGTTCEVRRVTPAGLVTTIAGAACSVSAADGAGSAALFGLPVGIAYDAADGNLYVTDSLQCSIRQVTTAGVVTTIAGYTQASYTASGSTSGRCGDSDGTGTSAHFYNPQGIAYDAIDHNLYVTDSDNCAIRKVTTSGTASTLSGNNPATTGLGCGYADGPASTAQFAKPAGLTVTPDGNLYVLDSATAIVRQVNSAGAVITVAGSPLNNNVTLDGFGGASRFRHPYLGAAADPSGSNLYVTDLAGQTVRQVRL